MSESLVHQRINAKYSFWVETKQGETNKTLNPFLRQAVFFSSTLFTVKPIIIAMYVRTSRLYVNVLYKRNLLQPDSKFNW